MNMPVLPANRPSPSPSEGAARPADAGSANDAPAFSNVLSSQRGATTPEKQESTPATGRPQTEKADRAERQETPGPDETLALILNSVALPLMQAQPQPPDATRRTTPDSQTGGLGLMRAATRTAATSALAASALAASTLAASTATADSDTPADVRRAAVPSGLDSHQPRDNRGAVALNNKPDQPVPLTGAETAPATATPRVAASKTATVLNTRTEAVTDNQRSGQASTTDSTGPVRHAQLAIQPAATPDVLAAAAQAAPIQVPSLPAAPATAAPATPQVSLSTPLDHPQWPQDFSRQILSLTQSGVSGHTVQMHVNPPELGPVHITLHLGDTIAQASFVSPHASVRQALENALPHLEQQMAQAGLSLGQSNVSDQQPGQQQFAQQPQQSRSPDGATFSLDGGPVSGLDTTALSAPSRTAARPNSLVDTFV